MPERPEIGYRANSALTGHRSPIVRPADCDEPLVAEGELVAVIGRPLRHLTAAQARDGIFGWTMGNVVSARGWQRSDRTFWRCKNSDTFKPMGPFIVTDADPLSATTTVRVDGEVKASFPTGDLLFGALWVHILLYPAISRFLRGQVAALSLSYTVITIDLRGFGNSRWEADHDARNFPGDIIAVLDAIAAGGGPSRAVLVGQSIGAAAALRAALDRPDQASGVILAHSLGGLQHSELTALVKADRAVAEKLPVLDRLLTPSFRASRPDLAFLFRQMGTFNTAKMQDLRNLNSDGPAVDELARAQFPVMLLAGEKDAVLASATVRRAGELLPGARVEVVTGAPHSVYWETPVLFNDAVASFLKDVATA